MIHSKKLLAEDTEKETLPLLMSMGNNNTIVMVTGILYPKGGREYSGVVVYTNDDNFKVGDHVAAPLSIFKKYDEEIILSNNKI